MTEEAEWIAVLPFAWGVGSDEREALENALVHFSTSRDYDGDSVTLLLHKVKGDWTVNSIDGSVTADEIVTSKEVSVELKTLERLELLREDVSYLMEAALVDGKNWDEYSDFLTMSPDRRKAGW